MKPLFFLNLASLVSALLIGCVPFASTGNKNWELASAAATGDTTIFEKKINEVQDVNSRPTISKLNQKGAPTILMVTAYGDYKPERTENTRLLFVKQLIKAGADPFLKDEEGRTAVEYAKLSGSRKIALYLQNYMSVR